MSRRVRSGWSSSDVVDRRRPGQHGDPLALDDLEHDAGVEHREREDRRAAHEAREAAGLVAEDVEERVRDQVAVAGAQVGPVAPVEVRAQRLAVRHHDALRAPGRARREHDVARIVGADRRDPRVEIGVGHRAAAVDEVVPADRRAVGLAGEQDRVLERGQVDAGAREQRRVVGVEEPAHGEQRAGAAALEDVRRLGAAEPGVDRHERRAGGRDAERGDDPLERVRRPDRDPVAALDARREQRARRGVDHRRAASAKSTRRSPSTTASASPRAARGVAHHRRNRRPRDLAAHASLAARRRRGVMRCIVRVWPW